MRAKVLTWLPAPLQHSCPRCSVPAGTTCITKSGAPAREMHSERIAQLCQKPFLVDADGEEVRPAEAEQYQRLRCAKRKRHHGQHANAARDLLWSTPVIIRSDR